MYKRGQFYIIIVIILALSIFLVSGEQNTIKEVTLFQDFDDISENYVEEAPKVVNYAVYVTTEDPNERPKDIQRMVKTTSFRL